MKQFALLALLGVAGIAIWKHHLSAAKSHSSPDVLGVNTGVSVYPGIPAPSTPQQVLAAHVTNTDAVSEPGFAPAFGPDENTPGFGETEL